MFIKHTYLPAVMARFIAYKLRSMLLLHTFFTGTYAKLACCVHEASCPEPGEQALQQVQKH